MENNIHVADKFIEDTYGNFVNFAVRWQGWYNNLTNDILRRRWHYIAILP